MISISISTVIAISFTSQRKTVFHFLSCWFACVPSENQERKSQKSHIVVVVVVVTVAPRGEGVQSSPVTYIEVAVVRTGRLPLCVVIANSWHTGPKQLELCLSSWLECIGICVQLIHSSNSCFTALQVKFNLSLI